MGHIYPTDIRGTFSELKRLKSLNFSGPTVIRKVLDLIAVLHLNN